LPDPSALPSSDKSNKFTAAYVESINAVMLKDFVILSVLLLISSIISAQQDSLHVLKYTVENGDTIPVTNIEGVDIYGFRPFENRRDYRRHNRLVRNVKIVYPWAKLAGQKLLEYESILSKADSEREKRKIMKTIEKEIHDEYGGELKRLTISQGKILIKLVDRETGSSSYDLVKDFRGHFMAFFYQSFARIFGYNLKIKYDPEGEDKDIELIVKMIESGRI
jgi:hypothetical protein